MDLNEAQEILKKNGFILEEFEDFGKDPVFYPNKKKTMVNVKDFLGDEDDEPKIYVLKLRDDVNGGDFDPYWGYAGEGGEFVETVKEAQKFSDPNDPEIEELYHSVAEDAIMDPTADAWICEVINGKAKTISKEPDFPRKK